MGEVIALWARRGPTETAQDTIAAAVLAAGGRDHLARHLSAVLGVSVFGSTVKAWEIGAVPPPEDVLRAAGDIAPRGPEAIALPSVGVRAVPALSGGVVPELGLRQDRPVGLEYPPTADAARQAAITLWVAMTGGQDCDSAWVSEAAMAAGWSWSFDPADRTVAGRGRRRVTSGDVERLREAMAAVVTLDRLFGGGHVQGPLLALLTSQVTPLLEGRYSDQDGRAVYGVAAELTAQLAFSAYDGGRHGTAERAYITALRLAKAAGDRQMGVHILANMATQAVGLSQPREAVQLAGAAAAGVTRGTHPAVLAHVRTTEAQAFAMAGDAAGFRRALHGAEGAISRGRADGAPQWARYFTPAHWAGTAVRGFRDLDLARDALEHEDLALSINGANPRTRALHGALLATVHVAEGNVDRAVELATVALDATGGVQSERLTRRLATLQRRLLPHRTAAGVADVLDRINERTTAL